MFFGFLYAYDELIRDVLLWIPTHGRAKAGRPARTYIQQLCGDTGCCPEDLPRAMNDREEWRERVRDIRATSAIWWWWYAYEHLWTFFTCMNISHTHIWLCNIFSEFLYKCRLHSFARLRSSILKTLFLFQRKFLLNIWDNLKGNWTSDLIT